MTGVRGLEKSRVQWVIVAFCGLLTIMLVAATVKIQRQQDLLRAADRALLTNDKERQTLERDLARERSTREALALELGRTRSGSASPTGTAPDGRTRPPTLTLDPLVKRSGSPPQANIEAPTADTVVELRLLLPAKAEANIPQLQIVARDWSTGAVRWTLSNARLTSADGGRAASAYVTGEMLAAGAYEFVLALPGEGGPQPDAVAAYELAILTRRATR